MPVTIDYQQIVTELRKTLGKMEASLGTLKEAILWTDAEGVIQWCNTPLDRLLERPHISLLGKPAAPLLPLREHGVLLPERAHPVKRVLETKEKFAGLYDLVHGETSLPIEITGSYLKLGEDECAILVIRDISRIRDLAQVKLQSLALRAAANAIVITDGQGRIKWTNPSFTVLTGYTFEEVYDRDMRILKSGEQEPAFYDNLWKTILSGRVWKGEIVNRKKDGSHYVEEQTITPVAGSRGGMNFFIAIKQDITERKRAEAALRESEARMRGILDAAVDGIVTVSQEGFIETFNRGAENIFGYRAEEVLGKPVEILIPARYREKHERLFQRRKFKAVAEKVLDAIREVEGLRKDGTEFPVDISLSQVQLRDRVIYSGIVRDVSERKAVERMKKEFISTANHELRTPVTSIHGALGLIAGGAAGDLPPQAKTLVGIAHRNSERLISLINDILDVEKMESGKMDFKMEPAELMPIVQEAMEINQPYAAKYRTRFELVEGLPGVRVVCDAYRLVQVLTNLLSNAAKFSPPDRPVEVAVTGADGQVQVEVRDYGPGIPEAFHAKVFQKFAQADSSDARQKGGTGLGLYIARSIVERHRGTIGFHGAEGKGTTFFFRLAMYRETPHD